VTADVLPVFAVSPRNVIPLAAEEASRKAPSAEIAFAFVFVSFGSPSSILNEVMVAVVRSLIVTVIS
jgi:SH3-like domain-containing protein